MKADEINELVGKALATAPCLFEAVVNCSMEVPKIMSDRMPESWMQAVLMREVFKHGLWGFPEVRINHDLGYFESGGKKLAPEFFPSLKNKKIDLFIGDASSSLPGHMRLRAIVELKGHNCTWDSIRSDIERLRALKSKINGADQTVIFAYASEPLTKKEKEDHDSKVAKNTKTSISDFEIFPAGKNSLVEDNGRAYIYLYVVK
ncbi:MAG: hypothetical protein HY280_02175 [Nitrospinae bacterium]|nr:hypothetical protein [Nitrospinota bacterium]